MSEQNATPKAEAATGTGTANGSATSTHETFDPRTLTLNQDFIQMVGVKKETLRVPIQRPPKQAFFMIHPDPNWRIQVAALKTEEDNETYIVDRALVDDLYGEWVAKVLATCQTKQGGLYLWPVKLPGADGRIDSWNESALHILNEYAGRWIRVTANRELGAYDVVEPITLLAPPEWPASSDDLLRKAFRDRVIDRVDHPVINMLRGIA